MRIRSEAYFSARMGQGTIVEVGTAKSLGGLSDESASKVMKAACNIKINGQSGFDLIFWVPVFSHMVM